MKIRSIELREDGGAPVTFVPARQGLGLVGAFYFEKLNRLPTPAEARARLFEAIAELASAMSVEGPETQLKELADVLYAAYGYALARGWNLAEAFELVHASNMTKQPTRGDGAKIQKGEAYVPPDLRACIGGLDVRVLDALRRMQE